MIVEVFPNEQEEDPTMGAIRVTMAYLLELTEFPRFVWASAPLIIRDILSLLHPQSRSVRTRAIDGGPVDE